MDLYITFLIFVEKNYLCFGRVVIVNNSKKTSIKLDVCFLIFVAYKLFIFLF